MFIGMPKIAKILTAIEVKRITKVGWHAVGGVAGLLLQVREPAKASSPIPRSWILRVRIGEERKAIGLGPYPQVSLSEAREHAKKLVVDARKGVNLVTRKRTERSALLAAAAKNRTFEECAAAYMNTHSSDYTNEKHRKQWASTLKTYANPVIGKLLVADISMRHVLDVLLQDTNHRNGKEGKLWEVKTETAKRLLDRIRTIMDYAIVNEYRAGTNPATWKGYLDTQLPSPKGLQQIRHQPALPYEKIGIFMGCLRRNDSISAKALEFLMLTGVRSGSVRNANWDEIDFQKKLWIVPAEHTKAGREHRVPLQPQAIKLLESLTRTASGQKIFPSPTGKSLSDMALSQLMRGMKERGELTDKAVPHGFRTTFRVWAAEQTNYPDEIRKVASMHSVNDSVKEAYQRTDLLEKRRYLMNDWADFIESSITDQQKNQRKRRKT